MASVAIKLKKIKKNCLGVNLLYGKIQTDLLTYLHQPPYIRIKTDGIAHCPTPISSLL